MSWVRIGAAAFIVTAAVLLVGSTPADAAVFSVRHHDVATIALTGTDDTGGVVRELTGSCTFHMRAVLLGRAVYTFAAEATAVSSHPSALPSNTAIGCEVRRFPTSEVLAALDVTMDGPAAAAVDDVVGDSDYVVFCAVVEATFADGVTSRLTRQCTSW